jgi:hypothetical protein
MEMLRDLLLTQATKLFKIGLFVKQPASNEIDEVYVFDGQTPYGEQTKVAQFFLRTFLGCRLAEESEVTTERFFLESQRYFNDHIQDGPLRVQYTEHLVSELNSQTGSVSPRSFAERYLQQVDRQPFLSYLVSVGVE